MICTTKIQTELNCVSIIVTKKKTNFNPKKKKKMACILSFQWFFFSFCLYAVWIIMIYLILFCYATLVCIKNIKNICNHFLMKFFSKTGLIIMTESLDISLVEPKKFILELPFYYVLQNHLNLPIFVGKILNFK